MTKQIETFFLTSLLLLFASHYFLYCLHIFVNLYPIKALFRSKRSRFHIIFPEEIVLTNLTQKWISFRMNNSYLSKHIRIVHLQLYYAPFFEFFEVNVSSGRKWGGRTVLFSFLLMDFYRELAFPRSIFEHPYFLHKFPHHNVLESQNTDQRAWKNPSRLDG